MRSTYVFLVSSLGLAAAGLTAALVWAVGLRTGYCDRFPPPSGWVDGVLVALALFFGFAVPLFVNFNVTPTRTRWIFMGVSLAEAAAAIAIVLYLGSKFAHWNYCG